MNEQLEKLRDEALLSQFKIDKQIKITTSLTMVIQRQLVLLARKTQTPVEQMSREFIVENLANVKVMPEHIDQAEIVVNRVLKK